MLALVDTNIEKWIESCEFESRKPSLTDYPLQIKVPRGPQYPLLSALAFV